MLEVSDDGCGMDAETKSHIFEPFYTTKADGRGTGLGLATVYGLVKQNNGYITVLSELNQGTTIRILWPRCSREAASVVSPAAVTQVQGGTETVLLVEDEPMVLDLSRHMLESLGYTVITAASPGEALRVADLRGGEIDLIVTDVVMPEMHGPELARRLQTSFPHLKCLFVSAYFSDSDSTRAVLDEAIDFLQKPFSATDLAARVRQALETP
jgi:CheY-like chemotaxis protein